MDNYFDLHMTKSEVGSISNLGLAHMGDSVFEILVRGWLCSHGKKAVRNLHREAVRYVCAPAQSTFMEKLEPMLTEEEMTIYRRGRNTHVHGVPKNASPKEYARATGLEALFGYLYLTGDKERLNTLFISVMEELYGL